MPTTQRKRRRHARPFLPTTMRAAAIDRVGPASVLKIHELPVPKMGARDVMIAVDTAGVGSWEPYQRSGVWGVGKAHFPVILGSDGSGTVVARGARVRRFHLGEDVAAFARRLGADVAIDGKGGTLAEALDDFAPDGIDAVLGLAGGKVLTTCIDALKRGGRVAYPNGVEPAPRKRRGIKFIVYDAEMGLKQFARLNRAIAKMPLTVPIAKQFPLEQAAQAHRQIEKGHVLGRVVLRVKRS